MEKKLVLMERNNNKDEINCNRSSTAYNRGVVDFVDETTNEIIFQARNKVILCGISSGANILAGKKLAEENPDKLVVTVVCDFGERYLSTELFS